MSREPAKRGASEAVRVLVAPPVPAPADAKRPPSIAGGALLVLLRCVGGVLWVGGAILAWPEIREDIGIEPADSALGLSLLVGFSATGILVLATFAWLLWRGSNRARMLAMCWSAASITTAAIAYFAAGAEITVKTTLLTLSLDILLLLALSSRDARAWTLGKRDARRGRTRERRARRRERRH